MWKTLKFREVRTPPGGFAPAGPSPRSKEQRLRRDQGLRPSSPKGSTLTH